ncbi:hypothetical protein [Providencia vermicola]|uniref:hypothetical protein n=1 Tax=Providencia vermicola TaxID=333965 RepID=UPI0034E5481B
MMTTREQDFIFKELKSVCDKHYIIIVDYNNKRLSIGVPKKPHDNVLATLRFIAGVPVCYDIWPKEKIDHYSRIQIISATLGHVRWKDG